MQPLLSLFLSIVFVDVCDSVFNEMEVGKNFAVVSPQVAGEGHPTSKKRVQRGLMTGRVQHWHLPHA